MTLQENALRVMCLTRERLETLLLSRGCSGGGLGSSPGERHQGCHAAGAKAWRSLALCFSWTWGVHQDLQKALKCRTVKAKCKSDGGISQSVPERPRNLLHQGCWLGSAPGKRTQESPAAELLSEHCFAGKCSTSHVLAPGDAWERSWLASAAP